MKQENLDLFDTSFTQEMLKKYVSYDLNTGIFIYLVGRNKGLTAGSKMLNGYLTIFINGKSYYCHRLAWFYVYGFFPPSSKVIDHINGIRTDNFISNLRIVSYSENQQNQRTSTKNSSTGFLGVHINSSRNCFRASLKLNGKVVFRKNFKTAKEAYQAYVLAKRKYHSTCTI